MREALLLEAVAVQQGFEVAEVGARIEEIAREQGIAPSA